MLTEEQQDTLVQNLVRDLDFHKRNLYNIGTILAATFLTDSIDASKIQIDAVNGLTVYDGNGILVLQIPVHGTFAGSLLSASIIAIDSALHALTLFSPNLAQGIIISQSPGVFGDTITFAVGSNPILTIKTDGSHANSSTDFFAPSTHGLKDEGSNSAFIVTTTVAQIKANGLTTVAEFGTGGPKVYIDGAFRTLQTFDDGSGHHIVYYA